MLPCSASADSWLPDLVAVVLMLLLPLKPPVPGMPAVPLLPVSTLLLKAEGYIRVFKLMLWAISAPCRAVLLLDTDARATASGCGGTICCCCRWALGVVLLVVLPVGETLGEALGLKAASVAAATAAAAAKGDRRPPGPTAVTAAVAGGCWEMLCTCLWPAAAPAAALAATAAATACACAADGVGGLLPRLL